MPRFFYAYLRVPILMKIQSDSDLIAQTPVGKFIVLRSKQACFLKFKLLYFLGTIHRYMRNRRKLCSNSRFWL